jgi:hypothetical protein
MEHLELAYLRSSEACSTGSSLSRCRGPGTHCQSRRLQARAQNRRRASKDKAAVEEARGDPSIRPCPPTYVCVRSRMDYREMYGRCTSSSLDVRVKVGLPPQRFPRTRGPFALGFVPSIVGRSADRFAAISPGFSEPTLP